MDINKLAQCLKLSTNNTERKENEDYISGAKFKENYGPALLHIACDVQYHEDIQLSAGIQLKNYISENWKFGDDLKLNKQLMFEESDKMIVISQVDKEYLKVHILDALVFSISNVKLMKQLNQCIKKMCRLSFEQWKEFFMNKIIEFFKSGNDKQIYAGILAFYQSSKVFEFESREFKASYNKAFEILNPYFLTFLDGLIQKLSSPEAAWIVYKILKIFYKNIQMDMSHTIMDAKTFESWNLYIISVKRFRLADNLLVKTEKPTELDDLKRNVYWKLKNLCFSITYRIYSKYGSNIFFDKTQPLLIAFADLIINNYVKIYFDVYLETLFKSKAEFVSEHIICLIYKFLAQMLSRFHFVEEIEKNLQEILKDHIVQDSMFTLRDFELWSSDPKSYINKQFDFLDGSFYSRYAVCQFVQKVCTFKRMNNKGKLEKRLIYYDDCFKFLGGIIETYEENVSKGVHLDERIKESVLSILESISSTIIKKSRKIVEKFIEFYVVKEFDSKIGFLRERACSFIEHFAEMKFENQNLLKEITTKICFILDKETELPVKVMAATTAPLLLKHSGVKELLRPSVPKLLEIYLNLVNTVDLEEILDGLETIIGTFSYEVKDYAVALTFELIKLFKKLVQTEEEAEDPKAETFVVIDGVLRTLLKIIELFVNNEDIFPKIEPALNEIILWGLKPENFEKLDDTLDFVRIILKKSSKVTATTWTYFPDIVFELVGTDEEYAEYKSKYPDGEYEGLGYENIADIIPIICLYISRDSDTFLNGVDRFNVHYFQRTFSLVQKIISLAKKNKDHVQNYKYAMKILNMIIDTQKGKIDVIVKEILAFLTTELSLSNCKFKKEILNTISACFNYDPLLTIQTVDSLNFVEKLFHEWFEALPKMTFEAEKKKNLLAFTSILTVDPSLQNKVIIANIKTLIDRVISLTGEIDAKKQKNLESKAESVDLEDDEDEFDFEESNREDDEAKREEQLNKLLAQAKASTTDNYKAPNVDDEDEDFIEDEDEDDEDWDEFEDLANITPVDKIDEILFVKEAFQHIQNSNSSYYEELMKLIDDESKVKLESYIKNAEKRKV